MPLTDYQYSILYEMGIPIWAKRQTRNAQKTLVVESVPVEHVQGQTLHIPADTALVIVVDNKELASIERRLLTTILKACKLDDSRPFLIESQSLGQISPDDCHNKKMIIMSDSEQSLADNIEYVQLPSLTSMTKQTSLKAVAWQRLKSYR